MPAANDSDPRPPARRTRVALALAGAGFALVLWFGPPWPLTLLANLAHVVGAAGIVGLPWALVTRRRRLFALQLGFVAALALVVPWRWISPPPALRAHEESGDTLRVLTYNLGTDLAGGDELARGLASSGADVIALEELSCDNARLLEDALSDDYPHRVLHPGGIAGRGLFSRHEITASEWFAGRQERRHLRVALDVDGRPLTIYVLHLSMQMAFLGRAASAASDLDEVLARASGEGAVILCGDFNTTERSADWGVVRAAGFDDSFRAVGRGPGFTFPIGRRYQGIPAPTCVRIDYVWHSPELAAERAWVAPDWGSDHRPVIADLRWVDAGS